MIRRIENNTEEIYEHRHLGDVQRIQRILRDKGYIATLKDCAGLWEEYSDSLAAGWIFLDEQDWDVWCCIRYKVEELAQ
jgi:hypothetical protein